MNITFISNYFNHHQSSLSRELHRLSGSGFRFVETKHMREERKLLGYGLKEIPTYVVNVEDVHKGILSRVLDETDLLICGSVPEGMVNSYVKKGKPVFRYSERPLKHGVELRKFVPRFVRWHKKNPRGKPIYLLAASAYATGDYAKFGLFRNRSYKWGYFPATSSYEWGVLQQGKEKRKILWAGRLLPWKHPDDAICLAKLLKNAGYDFSLDIIGIGGMEESLKQMISENNLSDSVHLLGAMKPHEVRAHMEKAGIFLFTSDRQEGWGAVLNESMNSGCAVVASHAIGAVPFLLKNGENGLVYRSGDVDMLYKKVAFLLDHPGEQAKLGQAAYRTIVDEWNAEVAAERFVNLAQHILNGEKYPDLYQSGPCSRAEIITESWF